MRVEVCYSITNRPPKRETWETKESTLQSNEECDNNNDKSACVGRMSRARVT